DDRGTHECPRLLMVMLWDVRTMDQWRAVDENPPTTPSRLALDNYGNIVYEGSHLVEGAALDELAANIEGRLEKLAQHTGGFKLGDSFRENLPRTLARFNELAATGKDDDFHRGENPIELIFNGEAREGNDTGNPTLYPVSESGPYYAALICAG